MAVAEKQNRTQTKLNVRWFHVSQRKQEWILAYACLAPWIIGFLIFTAGAMIFSFGLSFTTTDMLTGMRFVGLENFSEMFADKLVLKCLLVTFTYTACAVPMGLTFSLLIAMMLNQKIPGRAVWRLLYYLPSVVTGIAVAILWTWIFNPRIGLLNQVLALFGLAGLPWLYSEEWALPSLILMSLWGVGGNMLLYLAGLQGIPTELYDASKIDGANAPQRFRFVTLPMLSPTIFFTLIMSMIGAFQFFTEPLIMTHGGPNNATLSAMLYIYRKSFMQLHFGYASLLAWLLFTIILVFTLLVVRSSSIWVYYEGELRR